jgi:hypothetical protein
MVPPDTWAVARVDVDPGDAVDLVQMVAVCWIRCWPVLIEVTLAVATYHLDCGRTRC